jgi:F0F1-type ATP synthase membrane subunit b/b'
MLPQNPSLNEPQRNGQAPVEGSSVFYNEAGPANTGRFDIQEALNQIEELILDSPRLPLTGRTLIHEDEVLDQLDTVRMNLPSAFQEAVNILQQRDGILTEAEQYAQEIVATAEKQAAAILNDMTIIRQAEQQAQQLRSQVEQDCATLRAQTLSEIEQLRNQACQEWEDMRNRALTEGQAIQQDADAYADQVLQRMEGQFTEMLHVLRNGRQQLYQRQQQRGTEPTSLRRDLAGSPPVDPRQRQLGTQHRPIQPLQPPPQQPPHPPRR